MWFLLDDNEEMLMVRSGHTQAAAYLVGARAAEKLHEEYGL